MPYQTPSEIRIVDGESFFISNPVGDILEENTAHGFFYRDTRYLSRYTMQINEQELYLLTAKEVNHFWASFYTTLPYQSIYEEHPLTVDRRRTVGNGVIDEIIIQNYKPENVDLTITLSFDADFSDIMEIRNAKKAQGKTKSYVNKENNELIFEYQVGDFKRKTIIQCDKSGIISGKDITFKINLAPKEEWKTFIILSPVWEEERVSPEADFKSAYTRKSLAYATLQDWLKVTPKVNSNYNLLDNLYEQSLIDIEALKIYLDIEENPAIAAGMPWFMTLFGRDSLITAYQCCWVSPQKGIDILRDLARFQGQEYNDFRDEEPGKIFHEIRFGENTLLGELPYSPYYGTADATPLFLILLNEIYQWTGNTSLVNELKEPALKALEWIDKYGDLDGDGYVEYIKRSPNGLDNQCWKDSDISILFSNSKKAEPPLAVVEIQGYVYDAKLRTAFLAENVWNDKGLADKLRKEAKNLKEKFNRDFWIDNRGGYFAIALAKNKNKVDSMSSNMGQLLWSGIVNDDKAKILVKQLMSDNLYSGWGIRTMSKQDLGYNPIQYHNGTIWPHDNSLIAAGLAKYGYRDEANKIIINMIEASSYFENRLPEVFAGYERGIVDFPIIYPNAAFPQAWSAGACSLFIRIMLGLEPDFKNKKIKLDPKLPKIIDTVYLKDVSLFGKKFNIELNKDNYYIEEL